MCFAIGARSRFIDDLVTSVVNSGPIKTIVSLGAGLDTRPWRLDLAPTLRWIEVDFAHVLEYKTECLANEQPRCHLEQISADLTIESERERLFEKLTAPALLITEGLLSYLPRQTIAGLAAAAGRSTASHWISDISSGRLRHRVHGDLFEQIENLIPDSHLTGEEILDSISIEGWRQTKFFSYSREAVDLNRERVLELVRLSDLPRQPAPPNDPSGVHLFEKTS
jgi:methyltransferase (TIGR00027 family)